MVNVQIKNGDNAGDARRGSRTSAVFVVNEGLAPVALREAEDECHDADEYEETEPGDARVKVMDTSLTATSRDVCVHTIAMRWRRERLQMASG